MKALNLPPYDLDGLEWGVMGESLDWILYGVFLVHRVQTFVAAAVQHGHLALGVLEMVVAWVVRCLLVVPLGRHSQVEAGVPRTDDPCLVFVAAEVDLWEGLCWDSFFAEVEDLDDKAFVSHHPWTVLAVVLERMELGPGSQTVRTVCQAGPVDTGRHNVAAEHSHQEPQTQTHR